MADNIKYQGTLESSRHDGDLETPLSDGKSTFGKLAFTEDIFDKDQNRALADVIKDSGKDIKKCNDTLNNVVTHLNDTDKRLNNVSSILDDNVVKTNNNSNILNNTVEKLNVVSTKLDNTATQTNNNSNILSDVVKHVYPRILMNEDDLNALIEKGGPFEEGMDYLAYEDNG